MPAGGKVWRVQLLLCPDRGQRLHPKVDISQCESLLRLGNMNSLCWKKARLSKQRGMETLYRGHGIRCNNLNFTGIVAKVQVLQAIVERAVECIKEEVFQA